MDLRDGRLICLIRSAGIAAALLLAGAAFGQIYEVDHAFNPTFVSEDVTPRFFERQDGSLWVTDVDFVDGVPVEGIVRFRADGSMDTPLALPFTNTQPLEMVEVDGATIILKGPRPLRLLSDGTIDPSFQPPTLSRGAPGTLLRSTDGGVLVSTRMLTLSDGTLVSRAAFARLRADGSFDETFPDIEYDVEGVDDTGRIYVIAANRVKRYLASGLPDPTWTEVELEGLVRQFIVDPDGGGLARRSAAFDRLDVSGAIDPVFDLQPEDQGYSSFTYEESFAKFLADGRIMLLLSVDRLYNSDKPAVPYVVRLHADGRIDETYVPPETIGRGLGFWGEQPLVRYRDLEARPYFAGRLQTDGQVDPSWSPAFGRHGTITALRADLEGRILVAGYFEYVGANKRNGVVRFRPDGSVDDSFVPPAEAPFVEYRGGGYVGENGYDRIRIGRDGSIFLYTTVFSGPRAIDEAVSTRLTDSGALHSHQVKPVGGGFDVSATADGFAYLSIPSSWTEPETGENFQTFQLVRRAPGVDSDEVLPVDFKLWYSGPSPTGAPSWSGSLFEVLADDRLLAWGLRSAPDVSVIVSADGAQTIPLPFTAPVNQSDFPIYGPKIVWTGGSYTQSTLQRVLADGSLDDAFVPSLQLGNLRVLCADGRGGVIALRRGGSSIEGEVIRLRGDGSYDPGLSLPNTEVVSAAVAADRSVFLAGYTQLRRLTLEEIATVSIELINPDPVAGRTVILSAGSGVSGDVVWRWQRDGVDIPGATGATFTLEPALMADSGMYRAIATVDGLTLESEAIELSIPAANARLVNLSARTSVGSNESQQIAGFVLAEPAQLVVRGVGPSLAPFGIQHPLADPRIVLRNASDAIAQNIGWDGDSELAAAFARVGAFPFPSDSADSALSVSLPAGLYTALISGSADGIGLAEVYLDSPASGAPLANLSVRARVGGGEASVIAGFFVAGDGPQRLLIRAVGPGLAPHGVTNPIPDPSFTIHRNELIVLTNDDATPEALAAEDESGAFHLVPGSGDAAAVVYLEPGGYTVMVTGDGGIVLVEIYALAPI